MASKEEKAPGLTLVLPVRTTIAPRPFWPPILSALEDLGVRTEIIAGGVRPSKNRQSASRRRVLPSVSFVYALLRSSAPTLLCVEFGVPTLLSAVVARLTDRRTIIFQEHQRGNPYVPLRAWERRYRQLVVALADAVVANTDAAYAELADAMGIDRRRIFRATLLVPPERAALSRETGFVPEPSRRPLFLFVGRLVRPKNVGCLLSAAATLRARGFEFEVWIVGEGPERSKLEAQAAALIAEGVVRFLGARPNSEIGGAYEAADVFIMPTFRDYHSVAVLEALRFGTPVIDSVRDGNAGDSIRHEVTGLVFDPCEPRALAAAMKRALLEPEVFREMGERASAMMEEQTPQTAAAALRDILKAVQLT
jgi:glycosyltransferase involved in cell wall biosynthesis